MCYRKLFQPIVEAKQKHTQHSPSFLYTLLYRSREVGRKNNLKRYMAGCNQFIDLIKGSRVEVKSRSGNFFYQNCSDVL